MSLRTLPFMNLRNLKIDFLGLLSVSVFLAFVTLGVTA